MNKRCRVFSFLCVLLLADVGAAMELRLAPARPQGLASKAPPLSEEVPDADILGSDVHLEPLEAYRWITEPGSPFKVALQGNALGQARSVVLTAWDWENRPVAQREYPPVFKEELTLQVQGRGTYVLTLDGLSGGKGVFRLVRSFSVCPDNTPRRNTWKQGRFWIGQCSFPGWHNAKLSHGHFAHPEGMTAEQSMARDAELQARMGLPIVRINLDIRRKDQQGRELDFTWADQCVETFVAHGVELDLQLFMPYGAGQGPILKKYAAVPPEKAPLYPLEEDAQRFFVKQVVERYGQHARFFQIGNEPDNTHQYLGAPEDFANTLRQSREEIRGRWPNAAVTNGGYAFSNSLTAKVAAGTLGLTDFISYHCHYDFPALKKLFAEVQDIHQRAGYKDLPYAMTEMGFGMYTVAEERGNAQQIMQKLLYCWAHGHLGVMLYSSRELWWPRQYKFIPSGHPDYGFVDHFYCPRFVYGAVSALMDHYAGASFEAVLKESDNFHAYRFRRGDDVLVAFFTAEAPLKVGFTSDGKRATLLDLMGNESALESPSVIAVEAGNLPQTLVFHGARAVSLSQP